MFEHDESDPDVAVFTNGLAFPYFVGNQQFLEPSDSYREYGRDSKPCDGSSLEITGLFESVQIFLDPEPAFKDYRTIQDDAVNEILVSDIRGCSF